MRRKIFFYLDRLQISRGERLTVGVLLICLAGLSLTTLFAVEKPGYDTAHYEELERIFRDRSERKEAEDRAIAARYSGVESALPLTSADTVTAAGTMPADSVKVDLNAAGLEELQTLPGIGPVYAERILEWRDRFGDFHSVEQLLEIRGIGERRLDALRPRIVIEKGYSHHPVEAVPQEIGKPGRKK